MKRRKATKNPPVSGYTADSHSAANGLPVHQEIAILARVEVRGIQFQSAVELGQRVGEAAL